MNNLPAASLSNRLFHGDSTEVLQRVPDNTVDLIATDPPYLVNYRDRTGRSIHNDDPTKAEWLPRAFTEMFRVLKPGSLCLTFYGWNTVEKFQSAWNAAGFIPVGHIVFQKDYASRHGITKATHECAYLLSKGRPKSPRKPLPDVLAWGRPSGNRLHPTQKPVAVFEPIIDAYSEPGALILDPFAGSASAAVAARKLGRQYLAIELDWQFYQIAWRRLHEAHRSS